MDLLSNPDYLMQFACKNPLSKNPLHKKVGGFVQGFTRWSVSEIGEILQDIAVLIEKDKYRPQPPRQIAIPKASGGVRQLKIRNAFDRLVSRALYATLLPLMDVSPFSNTYSYLPHKSMWDAIDRAETMVKAGKLWFCTADVENAFDCVSTNHACSSLIEFYKSELMRPKVENLSLKQARLKELPRLKKLVKKVLQGNDQSRSVGIDQGDPLSPLAFIAAMVNALRTRQREKLPDCEQIIYSDNLLYVAASRQACLDLAKRDAERLSKKGLTLKIADPVNLARQGAKVPWLGVDLSLQKGVLHRSLSQDTLRDLRDGLVRSRDLPRAAAAAESYLCGWLAHYRSVLGIAKSDVRNRAKQLLEKHGLSDSGILVISRGL